MNVGEYIELLEQIIDELSQYDQSEHITISKDEEGYATYIIGDIGEYAESLN